MKRRFDRPVAPHLLPFLALMISALPCPLPAAAQSGRRAAPSQEIHWGKAVNGLQAGLQIVHPQNVYTIGQQISLQVFVRNIGRTPVAFSHLQDVVVDKQTGNPVAGLLYEFLPTVVDKTGKRQDIGRGEMRLGEVPVQSVQLAPGKIVVIGSLTLGLEEVGSKAPTASPTLFVAPGSYTVRQTFPFQRSPGVNESLTTGSLKVTIAEGGPGSQPLRNQR